MQLIHSVPRNYSYCAIHYSVGDVQVLQLIIAILVLLRLVSTDHVLLGFVILLYENDTQHLLK